MNVRFWPKAVVRFAQVRTSSLKTGPIFGAVQKIDFLISFLFFDIFKVQQGAGVNSKGFGNFTNVNQSYISPPLLDSSNISAIKV